MLDPYIPIIEEWLAAVPNLFAVDFLSRLEAHAPGRFGLRQRRKVQQLVKNLRSKAARQLISSAEITLSTVAFQADRPSLLIAPFTSPATGPAMTQRCATAKRQRRN
jgi:hypothetical protein